MPWLNPLLIAYGLLSIGLGVYGFVVKDSPVSLIAGGLFGLLMIGTVLLVKKSPRFARIGSLVVALVMLGKFLPDFIRKQDWLPAGTMAIASAVVIVALLAGHLMANVKKPA